MARDLWTKCICAAPDRKRRGEARDGIGVRQVARPAYCIGRALALTTAAVCPEKTSSAPTAAPTGASPPEPKSGRMRPSAGTHRFNTRAPASTSVGRGLLLPAGCGPLLAAHPPSSSGARGSAPAGGRRGPEVRPPSCCLILRPLPASRLALIKGSAVRQREPRCLVCSSCCTRRPAR